MKRGTNHDMLTDNGVYAGLMCAAMHGKLEAVVGGPNCRTRSVLRHYPKEGAPRPVREWGGQEHGLSDLSAAEKQQVLDDDVLLWRFLFLWMVATYLREARQVQQKVGLLLEQPASPRKYMPQCVSFWDTTEWKELKEEFHLQEVTFCQGHHGGAAVKPTTMGGTLELNVEGHRMKRAKDIEVQTSSQLSRWAPGTMNMVSEALMTQVARQKPRLAPLSWEEHVQHGHVPFRRDCLVCQQSLQQQPPHRRVQHKIGGVLSLDTTGPFIRAPDLSGYKAAYILVGVLTWTVPKDSKLKEDEVPELEPGAPNFDAKGEEEALAIEDQHEDPPQEVQGVFDDEEEEEKAPEGEDAEKAPEGEDAQKAPEGEGEKKAEKEEERKEFETRTFRLASPMFSKKAKEVVRATMDMLLRLRADGFHIAHIHSDQGHEFSGTFRQWCRQRGIRLTRTPGDDPRANGRAEVAVKSVKTQIRRILLQAEANSSWWPWATRFVNELNRAARIGKKPDWPPFLTEVLVRKRKWRQGTFEASTEKVQYLCPAPEEHGHWILPKDEPPRVTKMLVKPAQLPLTEETWIALEKETVDALVVRRRVREKSTIKKVEENDEEEVERKEEEKKRVNLLRFIEQEMRLMVEDDASLALEEMKLISSLKKMAEKVNEEEEILQTRIVSQREVSENWKDWTAAAQSEVESMLKEKEAFCEIFPEELSTDERSCRTNRTRDRVHPFKACLHQKAWTCWRPKKYEMGDLWKLGVPSRRRGKLQFWS